MALSPGKRGYFYRRAVAISEVAPAVMQESWGAARERPDTTHSTGCVSGPGNSSTQGSKDLWNCEILVIVPTPDQFEKVANGNEGYETRPAHMGRVSTTG